jgi:hypothetical protein
MRMRSMTSREGAEKWLGRAVTATAQGQSFERSVAGCAVTSQTQKRLLQRVCLAPTTRHQQLRYMHTVALASLVSARYVLSVSWLGPAQPNKKEVARPERR